MTFRFDLREDATRATLLGQLLGALDEKVRDEVLDKAENCGIETRHHHDLSEVDAAIDAAMVSDRVKEDAHAIYRILAEAEASAHGCTVEETHFHEVGNGAGIRNVIAMCCAMEALSPEEVVSTPVQAGQGTVACAHGVLEVPAPATAAIIARGIPLEASRLEGERLTPTSAAVILHYVDRFERAE